MLGRSSIACSVRLEEASTHYHTYISTYELAASAKVLAATLLSVQCGLRKPALTTTLPSLSIHRQRAPRCWQQHRRKRGAPQGSQHHQSLPVCVIPSDFEADRRGSRALQEQQAHTHSAGVCVCVSVCVGGCLFLEVC